MAITRDDILYLLDQRVKPGPIPIIGADPVFSRDSARVYRSRDGHLRTAYVDTPVMEYRKDATGQYRNVLPLTLGRTNRVGYSRDYSQWTPNAVTPTGGQSDPTGETGATLLNATAASGNVNRNTTALSGLSLIHI